jgi:hypothetical protein
MPENQGHGKLWERDVGINVYKATDAELKTLSHTAPNDIPKDFNRLEGIDVSIKTTGKDTIDMADIVRVYDKVSSGEPIHMTVVSWVQNTPTTKKLNYITEVDLTNSKSILFGTLQRDQLETLVTLTKSVGRVRADVSPEQRDKTIAEAYAMRDELHTHSGYMHIHLMFYTNNASRVQGQFKKFSKFMKEHPSRVVAYSNTAAFRGGRIMEEITSTKRIRNKKE